MARICLLAPSILALLITACLSDDGTGDSIVSDDDGSDDDIAHGDWLGVGAGEEHTCGIRSDGALVCWGLTDNDVTNEPSGTYVQVRGGWDHSTAITGDGSVVSWGCFGEIGVDACDAPEGEFAQVSVGFQHSCALGKDGLVDCWGSNDHGQCDAPASTFRQVDCGGTHSCGVGEDGSLSCWGEDHPCVTDVPEGDFKQVIAVRNVTCALSVEGNIECWGCDFPDFSGLCEPPPGQFDSLGHGNVFHICAIAADGSVECWGDWEHGQSDPPEGSFAQVVMGAFHTCGLTITGDIECWGSDDHLQCSGGEYDGCQDQLEIPADSGVSCQDTEPNSHDYLADPPWDGAQECLGCISSGGLADVIGGTIDMTVVGTWDGDNDSYSLVVQEEGYLTGSLDWESQYHDLDWILQCWYGDEFLPEDFYLMIPTELTAYLNKPEEGQAVIRVSAGTECYAWVVGYDAPDGTAYELRLWMTYEDIQEE